MIFAKVPLINGEIDIDYRDLIAGFQLSEGLAFVQLKERAEVRESWELSAEEEFNVLKPVLPDPPPPGPSEADYLLDLDFRLSKLELGL